MLKPGGDLDFVEEPFGAPKAESSGRSTFTATRRLCFTSVAAKTVAMPPWPIWSSTRYSS